jgi:hypothetical protein
MSDYKVHAERTHRYELWVTAETPKEASRIAVDAITNGTRPPGVTLFWDTEGHLDVDVDVDMDEYLQGDE